ncbi:MAG TPA: riboflavin synthase [Gemmatimonadales bacterium]|nr:riboflavin synthase [Gemmatimonadales bacterium]
MFNGLVTAIGRVTKAVRGTDGLTLRIGAPYRGVRRGESIAVDGACLTVERVGRGWFEVHVVTTSLDRTAIGGWARDRRVNLERAVRAGDRLGGHIVQGHVDGVGRVLAVADHGDARLIDIAVPAEVGAVSIPLGSITVDGVSLTVNAIPRPATVRVSLIPETLRKTTLGERVAGDPVHLEGDLIGKYVVAVMKGRGS